MNFMFFKSDFFSLSFFLSVYLSGLYFYFFTCPSLSSVCGTRMEQNLLRLNSYCVFLLIDGESTQSISFCSCILFIVTDCEHFNSLYTQLFIRFYLCKNSKAANQSLVRTLSKRSQACTIQTKKT